jgi:hypothetical protein
MERDENSSDRFLILDGMKGVTGTDISGVLQKLYGA